jgi:very-short-patch-repair endonuclease
MTPDERCRNRAAKRYGLITREEALSFGLTPRMIETRLASGVWILVQPNVYAINGAPRSWNRSLLAACLSCAPAAASHSSAAALWTLIGFQEGPIEISSSRSLRRPGVRIHRPSQLGTDQIQRIQGIPTTDAARTLIDIGTRLSIDELEIVLDDALTRKLTSLSHLGKRLEGMNGKGWRGTAALKKLIRERASGLAPAESPLETKLFQVLREERLPLPDRQVSIYDDEGFIGRVDLAYPDRRLILEAQSYKHHGNRQSWLKDVGRRQRLQFIDWKVIEVVWEDVTTRRMRFVRDMRKLVLGDSLFE